MQLSELIEKLLEISLSEDVIDPDVCIQIGRTIVPVNGIKYFPETDYNFEYVSIADKEDPELIL